MARINLESNVCLVGYLFTNQIWFVTLEHFNCEGNFSSNIYLTFKRNVSIEVLAENLWIREPDSSSKIRRLVLKLTKIFAHKFSFKNTEQAFLKTLFDSNACIGNRSHQNMLAVLVFVTHCYVYLAFYLVVLDCIVDKIEKNFPVYFLLNFDCFWDCIVNLEGTLDSSILYLILKWSHNVLN